MNPKKIVLIAVVASAVVGVAAWLALNPAALGRAAATARLAWDSVTGQPEENGRLKAYGNIDVRQVNLSFYVGGRLESLDVEEGDRVEPGQVLASLEKGYLEDDIRSAEATVAAKRAQLEKLEAGNRKEEIAQARAETERAQAAVVLAKATFERRRDLAKTSAVSRQSLDEAENALREAQASLKLARASQRLMEIGARDEDIAAAEADLGAAEAALATAHRRYADSDLVSPSAGTVLTRVQEPGAVLQANTTVLTLALTDPVWVRAYIPEPDLGRIHPGMTADVYTDTRPDHPYTGQVGFISPVAEFTPKTVETEELRVNLVYRLRVIVEHPDEGLRQGMPVTVVFRTENGN